MDTKGVFCIPISAFLLTSTKRTKIHDKDILDIWDMCDKIIHYCHCFHILSLLKKDIQRIKFCLLVSECTYEKTSSSWQASREEKARAAINVSAQFVSNWFLSRDH